MAGVAVGAAAGAGGGAQATSTPPAMSAALSFFRSVSASRRVLVRVDNLLNLKNARAQAGLASGYHA